jgi:hypothetical protein
MIRSIHNFKAPVVWFLMAAGVVFVLGGCDLPGIIEPFDRDATLEPDAAPSCPVVPRCGRGNFVEQCAPDGTLEVVGCGLAEVCTDGVCEDLTGTCDASRGRPFRLSRSELVFDVPELLAECDCTGPSGCECAEVDYKSQQRQIEIENCTSRSIFIQDVRVKDNAVRPDGEPVFALDRSYRDIAVPPGSTRTIDVFYRPAPGVSQLARSDLDVTLIGDSAEDFSVPLRTRSFCATATPVREIYTLLLGQEITFDAVVANCGTEPITLTGASAGQWKGPGAPDVHVPEKLPFVLSAGQSTVARVRVDPEEPGVFEGTVRFAFEEDRVATGAATRVAGAVVRDGCTDVDLPKLDVYVGSELIETSDFDVEPGANLRLAPRELPEGVVPLFSVPESPDGFRGRVEVANDEATIAPGFVGDYLVRYRAFDSMAGQLTCAWDDVAFSVSPTAPLYVELSWRTRGDLIEDDAGFGRGADLDLYVLSAEGVEAAWDRSATACFPEADEPCGVGEGRRVSTSRTGLRPEAYAFGRVDGVAYSFGAYLRNTYNFEDGVEARLRVWRDGELIAGASRSSPSDPDAAPRLRATNTFWLASSYAGGVVLPQELYKAGIP